MKKTGVIPYDWSCIEDGIRDAIVIQAINLDAYGIEFPGNRDMCEKYLGIDLTMSEEVGGIKLGEEQSYKKTKYLDREEIDSIKIDRHYIYFTALEAYHYAYQINTTGNEPGQYENLEGTSREVSALLNCFPQFDYEGNSSPFDKDAGHPLRIMFETFQARFSLFEEKGDLAIKQLALLANMTVPATRASMSKEGFRLEKISQKQNSTQDTKLSRLKYSDAILWLSRRRGFIPQLASKQMEVSSTQIKDIFSDPDIEFPKKLKKLFDQVGITIEQLVSQNSVDGAWIKGLVEGAAVEPYVDEWTELAKVLSVSEAELAAKGVEYLLSKKRNA